MSSVVAALVGVEQPGPITIGRRRFTFQRAKGVQGDLAAYQSLLRRIVPADSLSLSVYEKDHETRRDALLASLSALLTLVGDYDTFVLVLVGHGFQVHDPENEEPDHYDEVFAAKNGPIVDDEFRKLWSALPSRSNVVSFVDTCHADSLAMAFTPQNEHIYLGSDGPSRLTLAASKQEEKAFSVKVGPKAHRGAWSLALETTYAQEQSLLEWFRCASQDISGRHLAQTPQLRYIAPDDGLLNAIPFGRRA